LGSFAAPQNQNPSITTTAASSATAVATSNNPLTDGGLPWYLSGFEIRGTTAVEERWTRGRDAVRSLSEELTDMDEDALRDLEFDVDEENTISVHQGDEDVDGNDGDAEADGDAMDVTPPVNSNAGVSERRGSLRKAASLQVVGGGVSKKKGKAEVSAGRRLSLRKGVRSSARKR
jgi:NuA3 HAT complex component NTO1